MGGQHPSCFVWASTSFQALQISWHPTAAYLGFFFLNVSSKGGNKIWFWSKVNGGAACVLRALTLLHPALTFSCVRTAPWHLLYIVNWREVLRLVVCDFNLGFDHSSPKKERKKKSAPTSIFRGVSKEALSWERRKIPLGIEAIQRTGESDGSM